MTARFAFDSRLLSLLSLSVALVLTACSSGGASGGGTTAPPVTQSSPQGVYSGTTSNGETFETIILPDNKFYALYGTTSGNTFSILGMIVG